VRLVVFLEYADAFAVSLVMILIPLMGFEIIRARRWM
jgi:hypothetical protein